MRIYVAGPYSKGNPEENTSNAIYWADCISELGHTPYIPHLTHFWEKEYHHPYEFWMEYDLKWLRLCDAVFRFSGDSNGADEEVRIAREMGIPIFYSLSEIDDSNKLR